MQFVKVTQVVANNVTIETLLHVNDFRMMEPIVRPSSNSKFTDGGVTFSASTVGTRRMHDAQTRIFTGIVGKASIEVVETIDEIHLQVTGTHRTQESVFPKICEQLLTANELVSVSRETLDISWPSNKVT